MEGAQVSRTRSHYCVNWKWWKYYAVEFSLNIIKAKKYVANLQSIFRLSFPTNFFRSIFGNHHACHCRVMNFLESESSSLKHLCTKILFLCVFTWRWHQTEFEICQEIFTNIKILNLIKKKENAANQIRENIYFWKKSCFEISSVSFASLVASCRPFLPLTSLNIIQHFIFFSISLNRSSLPLLPALSSLSQQLFMVLFTHVVFMFVEKESQVAGITSICKYVCQHISSVSKNICVQNYVCVFFSSFSFTIFFQPFWEWKLKLKDSFF